MLKIFYSFVLNKSLNFLIFFYVELPKIKQNSVLFFLLSGVEYPRKSKSL